MDMDLGGLQELVTDKEAWHLQFMGSQRVGHDWQTELNGTELRLYSVIFKDAYDLTWTALVVQTVKNPPSMQETWVHSLGWKDTLEEGISTHSSILAWEIPWTDNREAWWATELYMAERLSTAHYLICILYERKLLLNLGLLLDTGYHY